MGRIKTIWDWVDEITYKKTHPDLFDESDYNLYNNYLMSRHISFYAPYIEIANYAQSLPPADKRSHYLLLKEYIPKKKVYFRWVKKSKDNTPPEIIDFLCQFFELGKREVRENVELLSKDEIEKILIKFGVEKKELKKLIKKL